MKTKEEKWVESLGWKKVKGFKIKMDELRGGCDDNWDNFYVEKDSLIDFVEKITYWYNDNEEDRCFEDVDSLIEFIEENSENKFKE